jgi:glutamyl-tRNA synthetase
MMVKVRFAPSPTGYLHIGGARTALINWLFAKKCGGKFVLRIEDTDEERSTPEMTQAILDGLSWLGITWDEGPFYQSERRQIHQEMAYKLLATGKAYRCFCTKEDIGQRKNALAKPEEWRYDRKCRDIPKEESDKRAMDGEFFVVRCRIPDERIEWSDIVKGTIIFESGQVEDFILLRSDMSPTYNLSVVADDHSMGITHIIRGEDHISNTPKQIALYNALGIQPALFGHLPLILGPDKKKLSKRHGTTSVTEYKDEGVLSLALFNFLASMGASLDEDRCLSREEIVSCFELPRLKKSPSVFDRERLNFLNGKLIGEMELDGIREIVMPVFMKLYPKLPFPEEKPLKLMRTRAKNLIELALMLYPFASDDFYYDEKVLAKLNIESIKSHFGGFIDSLEKLDEGSWNSAAIEETLRGCAESAGIHAKDLIHPSRLFLTGKGESPSIFDLFEAMGKAKTIKRLERGLRFSASEVTNV